MELCSTSEVVIYFFHLLNLNVIIFLFIVWKYASPYHVKKVSFMCCFKRLHDKVLSFFLVVSEFVFVSILSVLSYHCQYNIFSLLVSFHIFSSFISLLINVEIFSQLKLSVKWVTQHLDVNFTSLSHEMSL